MSARLCAFLVWAAVAATAVFWALRLGVRAPEAPPHTASVGEGSALRGDLSRLLGAAPVAAAAEGEAPPELASRFKLLGIMAPKGGLPAQREGHGVALIEVDGKPARAFTVGARLDDALVLQSVSLRSASIGEAQGATALMLELPPPLPAATGVLPPPGAAATSRAPGLPMPAATPAAAPAPLRPVPMPARPQAMPVPVPPPPPQDAGALTQ